ncbi:serine/threonine protein kinase [Nannocystis pusilla]|uniref:serine/threonine protein kinase n=1 Tax=Nannocystis pusilla TaxID=889268 RepID=UPI003BF18DA2
MAGTFPPRIGDRIAARYELVTLLRGSGIAHAFVAHDHHVGQNVELVAYHPECAHPNLWSAFARVIATAAAARIVPLVLPRGVADSAPVPPYCIAEPQTLRSLDRLRAQGPIPWQRALAIGERIAEVLEKTQVATKVAHRALLPTRCLVSARDEVKVLDYGVAELEVGRAEASPYRAPEPNSDPGDSRSDVYSLGAILFELLTGQRCTEAPLPRLRSRIAAPPSIDDFLAAALSQDPKQRHGDIAAMRARMRELLGLGASADLPLLPASPPKNVAPATLPVPVPRAGGPSPAKNVAPPAVASSVDRPAPAKNVVPGPLPSPFSGKPMSAPVPVSSSHEPRVVTPFPPRVEQPDRLDPLPDLPRVASIDVTEVLPPAKVVAFPPAVVSEVLSRTTPPFSVEADRTEVLPTMAPPTAAQASVASGYGRPCPASDGVDPPTEKIPVPVRPDTRLASPLDEPREPPTALVMPATKTPTDASAVGLAAHQAPTSDDGATEVWVKPVRKRDLEAIVPAPAITLAVPRQPTSDPAPPLDFTYFMARPLASPPSPAPSDPVPLPPPSTALERWSLQKILIIANLAFAGIILIALLIGLAT